MAADSPTCPPTGAAGTCLEPSSHILSAGASELGRGQDGGRLPNLPADRRGRHLPGAFFSHTIGRQWSRAGDDWPESNGYQE